jgi:hypothetical protein
MMPHRDGIARIIFLAIFSLCRQIAGAGICAAHDVAGMPQCVDLLTLTATSIDRGWQFRRLRYAAKFSIAAKNS